MDDRQGRRRFGARQHSSSAGPRARSAGGPHYQPPTRNTLEFEQVAAERSVSRPQSYHRPNWEDTLRDNFHFGGDDMQDRRREDDHRPDKYQSSRPKASGQSISAPGSSIVNVVNAHATASSSLGVTDAVLQKKFNPPKEQDDFLNSITSITKKNTMANRGAGARTRTMVAYPTPKSSLEAASAPAPKKDISNPPTGSSGWVYRREQTEKPKPRVVLASAEKRAKLADERRKTPQSVTRHYALRERRSSFLVEHSPTSTQSFSVRTPRSTRLGKRKMNSEGSAAKPIALDSDSDVEVEVDVQPDAAIENTSIVEEVLNDNRKKGPEEEQAEKAPAVESEDIPVEAVVQIHNCDVMMDLFQCIVDLYFQNDRMNMRNIRGKNDTWPFESSYMFEFKYLQDARLYSVSKDAESMTEIDVDEPDRMEQLLDEASYVALKLPLLKEADQDAMKPFYDPTGTDGSKAYMVLRPLEDATGGNLDEVRDILRGYTGVLQLVDKEQAKEHLQPLTKDPFSFSARRRSRRRKSTGENVESPPESDDDDVDGHVTVLTRYLNDNIIDYYFKRLMLEQFQDNEVVQEKVLFLSSHFYSRLRAGKGPTPSARMEAGYKNVSTWLSRSNFFNRSIIFIPINKDLHWSLAVIVNPGIAGADPCDNEEAFSCIGVLDPLGSYHRKTAIIRNLRALLRMEWGNSRGRSNDGDPDSEYAVDRVLTLEVKAPQQENSYDCGVYVLKFAEVILKNSLELDLLARNNGVISKDMTDDHLKAVITSSAFSAEDITATRKQIRQYIEADASKYEGIKKERGKAPKASKQE
ncbi:ubiquitin-specific protease 2A [Phytophthora cinnamomi]|uniref:ubiquitin-specific protease 2A n=1 Tax=Phytophthora cinnamomi TaxID=4785 RepID=UPI00355A07E6|nr:ubiquitin-specific protease 2A [Phytophthora cinnamomi]